MSVRFAIATAVVWALVAQAFRFRKSGSTSSTGGCAELRMENNGTHYTVPVEIGTPGQVFHVVPDTGSNALIIPSCVCSQEGNCGKESACFTGTNRSSTFALNRTRGNELQVMQVTFGSGSVQTVLAFDVANVGGINVHMTDGILLMTNQALHLPGAFEGILGLGVPNASAAMEAHALASIKAEARAARKMKREMENAPEWLKDLIPQASDVDSTMPPRQPSGFLEQADIHHFSICFNEEGGGVLKLSDAPAKHRLQNIGLEHWGLDFRGVSVGGDTAVEAEALFCKSENMSADQKTPCAIIPDSGTTAIVGPKAQVATLLAGICDGWARCRDNHTKLVQAAKAASKAASEVYGFDPWGLTADTKATVLMALLRDCGTWLAEDGSIDDEGLPNLHFHVRGRGSEMQVLKIPASSYIMLRFEEEVKPAYVEIPGLGAVKVANHTGKYGRVCMPALSEMGYKTVKHGDVWILGLPLFSQYKVGYDLSPPVAMSFTDLKDFPCGTCDAAPKANLLFTRSEGGAVRNKAGHSGMRTVRGPMRIPDIDTSRPL
mmetsp:Transcript_92062/g.260098  ORF Transcript_92062/g.260098 Transcript_92062/m.260098 type:complete len:548 (+) Transcript_92062:108-1751(+)